MQNPSPLKSFRQQQAFQQQFQRQSFRQQTSLSATAKRISATISATNFKQSFRQQQAFQQTISATSLIASSFVFSCTCSQFPFFFLSIFFILLRIKHTVFSASLGIFFLSNYIWLEKSNLPLANFFNISLHREKNVFFFLVQSTKAFFFSLQTY